MYFVTYSTNKLELTTPGWNVWEVKSNNRKGQSSYKILNIIIGGKKNKTKNVSISNSNQIVNNEREVIDKIFNRG